MVDFNWLKVGAHVVISPNIIRLMKSKMMRWSDHVESVENVRNIHRVSKKE
jgi:hypothetical protein